MELFTYQQKWADDESPNRFWAYDRAIGSSTAVAHDAVQQSANGLVVIVTASPESAQYMQDTVDRIVNSLPVETVPRPVEIVHRRSTVMLAMQKSPWMVVVDNAISLVGGFPAGVTVASRCERIRARLEVARVAIVEAYGNRYGMDGERGICDLDMASGVSVHRTRFADARKAGIGRAVASELGVEWSAEWEEKWAHELMRKVWEYHAS